MFKPANATKHLGDDDPFTEQPKNNGPKPPPFPNFASKPQGLHLSTAAHNQPTPVKGTMDVNFRFPETVNAKLGTPTSVSNLQSFYPLLSLRVSILATHALTHSHWSQEAILTPYFV